MSEKRGRLIKGSRDHALSTMSGLDSGNDLGGCSGNGDDVL